MKEEKKEKDERKSKKRKNEWLNNINIVNNY
jgi:hypothetical protein